MPKDILEVCREWQSYWGHHNEARLEAFAQQAGDEIARLRLVCRVAADQLEASYMHLSRDQYPGPPETIIDRLRTAETEARK